MHIDQMQLAQMTLNIDPASIPIVFRMGFVLFLILVMFLMKDKDQEKGVGRIND